MASIQRSGGKWRVQVYAKGVRDSQTFDTRQKAAAWALEREAQLRGTRLPDKAFADAMERYRREVAPDHGGARWELVRLKSLAEAPIGRRKLPSLSATDFAAWRDDRLAEVSPGTVAREMNLMRSVLEVARREWRWLAVNPMQDVRWPKTPKGRARGLSEKEIRTLGMAFGVWNNLRSETATHRVGLAFLFAIETAMRSGEICALQWGDVFLSSQYVVLPKTKNGDSREVPLSLRAMEILRALPKSDGPAFGLDDTIRDALWRKVRDRTPHKDIHFHDTRSEAIYRLSKKLDILELARVIGHRDLKSLLIYYRASASELAKRLG